MKFSRLSLAIIGVIFVTAGLFFAACDRRPVTVRPKGRLVSDVNGSTAPTPAGTPTPNREPTPVPNPEPNPVPNPEPVPIPTPTPIPIPDTGSGSNSGPQIPERCNAGTMNVDNNLSIIAGARKDFFYPATAYAEPGDDPVNGVRWHFAVISKTNGSFTTLKIGGKTADELMEQGVIDWYHVWPRTLTKGEPAFVALHSQNANFAPGKILDVVLETSEGTAGSGAISANESSVRLTSVVARENMSQFVVHLQNKSESAAQKISRVHVNGVEVSSLGCIPSTIIAPKETAVWIIPLKRKTAIGEAWSVTVEFENAPSEVAVGRVVPSFFPIESWGKLDECPYPGGNAANFAEHVSHGIDTFFVGTFGSSAGCPGKNHSDLMPNIAGTPYWMVLNEYVSEKLTRADRVAARLIGDEPDSADNLATEMQEKVRLSWEHWQAVPDVPTYIGASRNKRVGRFAGIADIQGMDIYAAACAQHVTPWGSGVPLRAPLDYLNATRLNHMPSPTWLYAQGFHSAWNGTNPVLGNVIHRQPRADELRIQAMSVIAAGAKGLMWFQTELAEAKANTAQQASWTALGDFNRDIVGVRSLLLESSLVGNVASSNSKVHVESLLSPQAMIIPVINFATGKEPTDIMCGAQQDAHWEILAATTSISISVPAWLRVNSVLEIQNGTILDRTSAAQFSLGKVDIPSVQLDSATPVRLFVLSGLPSVRDSIAAALRK